MAPPSALESMSEDEKIELVVNYLEAIHVVTAVEALSLGAKAELNLGDLYELIVGAAGQSWALEAVGRELLQLGSGDTVGSLSDLITRTATVIDIARSLKFPCPLATLSQQLLNSAKGHAGSSTDSAAVALAKLWASIGGGEIKPSVNASAGDLVGAVTPKRVGFVGLGAMGLGMANSIVRAGIEVHGYDAYPPSLEKFVAAGGKAVASLEEVATGTDVLVLMVVSADQANDILFGPKGIAKLLEPGASVVVSSTVPPSAALEISQRLLELPNKPLMVDAPVSGGAARAANGDLTIMASGDQSAMVKAGLVLDACTKQGGSKDKRLFIFDGGAKFGSFVKLAHQNLAGVHVAASAEAMAFAAKLNLPLRKVYARVIESRGFSWMYRNRQVRTIEGDATVLSAVDILVKDIGIVVSEATSLGSPVFLSSAAFYPFIYLSSSGQGRDDDTTIVRIYEPLGIKAHTKA